MRKLQDRQELDQLIEAGSFGHFPLFYQSWIRESFSDSNELKKITFSRAAETVHKIFDKIENKLIYVFKKIIRNNFLIDYLKIDIEFTLPSFKYIILV